MNKYIYIVLILLFLFIIFIINVIRKSKENKNDKNLQIILLDSSLFFDKIHTTINKKDCGINTNSFEPFRKTSVKLLKKLYNLGYYQSKLVLMNPESCLHFNIHKDLEICNGYRKPAKEKICTHCKDTWRQIHQNIGFLLENNLIKTYDENGDLFLYKTYKCSNNKMVVIGLILRV